MVGFCLEPDQSEETPPKKTWKGKRKSKKEKPREDTRKCSDCSKVKPVDELHDDQHKCKSCFNDNRALLDREKPRAVRHRSMSSRVLCPL